MGILNKDLTPVVSFKDCWSIKYTRTLPDWAWGICSALQEFFERNAAYWNMFIKSFSAQWCRGRKYLSRKFEQDAHDAMMKLAAFCTSFANRPVVKIIPTIYYKRTAYIVKPGIQIILHKSDKMLNDVVVDVKCRKYMNIDEWLSAYQPANERPEMKTINVFTL